MHRKNPILITGAHRSGTTWTGKMLGLSKETGYIHEPFNIDLNAGYSRLDLKCWFTYLSPGESNEFRADMEYILGFRYNPVSHFFKIRRIKDLLGMGDQWINFLFSRISDKRPLMKDPIAIMSAEWLYSNFNMDVVVMIRHPASFVSSINKLSWEFPFGQLLKQDQLLDAYLNPFKDELKEFAEDDMDTIEQAILLWRIIYYVVHEYQKKYPGWTFLRHEDLALNPVEEFKNLYGKLGLTYTDNVEKRLIMNTQSDNPDEVHNPHNVKRNSSSQIKSFKKRLSSDEIMFIKEKTIDIWPYFYDEEDW